MAIIFILNIAFLQAQHMPGPFARQGRNDNPLREPIPTGSKPAPVAVDFDKDGDPDIVVASFYGGMGFDYLLNEGSIPPPKFSKTGPGVNRFYSVAFPNGSTPAFSDLDKDGDLDMLLGAGDGTLRYYKSSGGTYPTFTLQTGAWNATTKSGNPFNGADLGSDASPAFIDADKDGDDDLIIGTSLAPFNKTVYYYKNDGNGNFEEATLTGINPPLDAVTPTFIDMDTDGDLDVIIGAADGKLYYFRRLNETTFQEETGSNNPFASITKGTHTSPTIADFDHDGDPDLALGAEMPDGGKLFYYLNKGGLVFEEQIAFGSPFEGVDGIRDAFPCFLDVDNDGDADLIFSTFYGSTGLVHYRNENGKYTEVTTHPFKDLVILNSFTPSFVDLDGDGDSDLAGGVNNSVVSIDYFKNENGNYVHQDFASGPFKDIAIEEGHTDFADIDADGDYDLFVSSADPNFNEMYDPPYVIRFFKNTGDRTAPVFTEITGAANPLAAFSEEFNVYPRFVDLDHDGDLDFVAGEDGTVVEGQGGNELLYYENTGSAASPVFTYRNDLGDPGDNPNNPAPAFVDLDRDGDLDMMIGDASGWISYYKNTNEAAATFVNSTPLAFTAGAQALAIAPELTVTDNDNDPVIEAVISIADFEPGKETLGFATQAGINGSFDPTTGILRFGGKASTATYQDLLRTVTYQYIGTPADPGGRQRDGELATISKNISIGVFDSDKTIPVTTTKVVTITSDEPPVFNDKEVTVQIQTIATVDLNSLVSDVNNDANLATLIVIQQPASGAPATVASGVLTVNYQSVKFAGTEVVRLRVCDQKGLCDEATITITVTNAPPVFNNTTLTLDAGKSQTLDLTTLISDSDGNIDLSTLSILQAPASGAAASIDENAILTIDYQHIRFTGSETAAIKVCDTGGACAENVITIEVNGTLEVEVFNAVAPRSQGDNKFMRITNLPQTNKVAIFNRWGDRVYAVEQYDSAIPGRRFEGLNDNGRELPSGTYYYKIEFNDQTGRHQTLTGYLSLKQQ